MRLIYTSNGEADFFLSVSDLILGDPGEVSRVDKMFVVKVYCKIETSPRTLLLNQFQKRLNCLLQIGQKKFFLANQRRGAAG